MSVSCEINIGPYGNPKGGGAFSEEKFIHLGPITGIGTIFGYLGNTLFLRR